MSTIEQAVKALDSVHRDEARRILTLILADDLLSLNVLFWMAAASDTSDERRKWLLNVLEIDPDNGRALRELEALRPVSQPKQVTEHPDLSQVVTRSAQAASPIIGALSNPPADAPSNQVPAIDASNVGIVTGIIIVSLIILMFIWVEAGISFFNVITPILLHRGNPQQVAIAVIISFILASANLIIIRGVVLHLPATEQRLTIVTILGCLGALVASAMLKSPIFILVVPLYIVVKYLYSTVKKVSV